MVGQGQVIEPLTSLSLCRQLQQSASLSDDELEYAMAGTASPPSEAAAGRSPEASRPGAADQAAAAVSDGDIGTPDLDQLDTSSLETDVYLLNAASPCRKET